MTFVPGNVGQLWAGTAPVLSLGTPWVVWNILCAAPQACRDVSVLESQFSENSSENEHNWSTALLPGLLHVQCFEIPHVLLLCPCEDGAVPCRAFALWGQGCCVCRCVGEGQKSPGHDGSRDSHSNPAQDCSQPMHYSQC